MKDKPRYIKAFYIYEICYILYWQIAPHFAAIKMANGLILYSVTTIIATGLIGYMAYRYFQKDDKNVNLFVLFSFVIIISVLSHFN